jgi:hypothetical protein
MSVPKVAAVIAAGFPARAGPGAGRRLRGAGHGLG